MSNHRKPQWWYSGFEEGWIQGVKHYLHCWNNTWQTPSNMHIIWLDLSGIESVAEVTIHEELGA